MSGSCDATHGAAPRRSSARPRRSCAGSPLRLLVFVIIFDRVFDGDDVRLLALLVHNVDHRGQRRRLARTGRVSVICENQFAVACKAMPWRRVECRFQPNASRAGWNLPASTIANVPFFLEHADVETRRPPNAKLKSAPPRSRTLWMCSPGRDVAYPFLGVLGLAGGPSTRCKIPCTGLTGGTPTRMCRSDAPLGHERHQQQLRHRI